jgi:hypothetical protein
MKTGIEAISAMIISELIGPSCPWSKTVRLIGDSPSKIPEYSVQGA